MTHLTFLQATLIGLLQGVTELFPVSSLGHSVLVPALVGGNWHQLVTEESASESGYLAFIVGLHVATALALICFFWRDWVRYIKAFFASVRRRRIEGIDERLAWLLIVATIPAGLTGLALEHTLRTLFAKPVAASVFLIVNGFILLAGERLRKRSVFARGTPPAVGRPAAEQPVLSDGPGAMAEQVSLPDDRVIVSRLSFRDSVVIGIFQVAALFAGISRSGITMVAGLLRGLDHENAARFSFLLATPIIFAAGVYKIPDLMGPNGNGIRGQVVAGAVVAFFAAYASVRWLTRYFQTRTLTPFAIYCLLFGTACLAYFH
jgi:undecaprenyl-diphosphatase